MKMTELWPIRPLAHPNAVIRGTSWWMTVLTDRLFRLEYEPEGRFRDTATQLALYRDFPVPRFTVREEDTGISLETDAAILRYDRKPFSPSGLTVTLKGAYSVYASVWHYGDMPDTLGGTARTLDEADGAIPLGDGLTSMKGYAVLDDSASMGMDETGRLLPANGHGTDLYLFAYGHDFTACLRDFFTLSGQVPAVPRFALGNWWSRYYPYTQESYMALMERFRAEGVPLTVSVLDMNWHVTDIDPKYGVGWTGYTWDREKFPDPEALLRWLHARGLRVTLNDHPADGVRPCEEAYPAMARAMGADPAEERAFPYDAADEAFQRAFEQTVLVPFEESGVDFWWLDWQQRGGSSDPGMDPLFTLNHTRFVHALERGGPALILSRYGGPGSHRYPLGFSGDTFATWASLAFQPFFTATAANIGYGWWSHDIGGHMHSVKDDELAVRWVQFGVFSPVMRLHSSTSRFMRKEPWMYPAGAAAIMKRYLRLRHRLIPWLYTQNLLASREKRLLLRPLYYDESEQRQLCYVCKNQYRLGDALTVCPVTAPMDPLAALAGAEAWIPAGTWTDLFTGDRYDGPGMLTLYRGLENIPVLAGPGAILPMDAADVPDNGAPLPETVLFKIFPEASGKTELIEDNGLLPQDGRYRQAVTSAAVTREDGGLAVEIRPTEGEISLLPEGRRYEVELYGVGNTAPDEASCAYETAYDAERRVLRLTLSAGALSGASLRWRTYPEPEPIDWPERLYDLLMPAALPFDLKDRVYNLARQSRDKLSFLTQLHRLSLPQALTGAILELLTVR